MQFHFQYRIWYSEDEIYLERKFEPCVKITEEDHRKILIGVNAGMELKDIPGIDDALQKMRDCVLQIDRWKNKDGTDRKTPLKKPRNVYMIEYFLGGEFLMEPIGVTGTVPIRETDPDDLARHKKVRRWKNIVKNYDDTQRCKRNT